MTITMDLAPEVEQMAKAIAKAKGISLEDYLVCYITSKNVGAPHSLELLASDIHGGILTLKSYIRRLDMFAPAEHTIVRKIGTLAPVKLKRLREIIAGAVNP